MRFSGTLVVSAGLLCLVGAGAPASAQQSRWNLRLETGPLFVLAQPPASATNLQVNTLGGHIRFGADFEPHERVSVALLYGIDLVSAPRNGVDAQQTFVAGLRVRPWYNREAAFLLPPNPTRKYRYFTDVFSDVWVDAHIGASLAAKNRLLYDAGLGLRVPVIWPVQVGFYARFQHAIGFGSDGSFITITTGLELNAGFSPVHGEPDEDGDGIPDNRDNCPHTPRNQKVNQWGCGLSLGSTPVPRCSDTDLDGVCDGGDDCPDTPLGKPVDIHGCPIEPPAKPSRDE